MKYSVLARMSGVTGYVVWHLLFYALCISTTLAAKPKFLSVLNWSQIEAEVWSGKPSLDLGVCVEFSSDSVL